MAAVAPVAPVTPVALLAAGLAAVALTVAIKWLIIGRYQPGEHPLWSFFVWRDEIINTCQEELAGAWLLNIAPATPLMSAYLRLMGSKVGRDVWCETMTIKEFDLTELGSGCGVNLFRSRSCCVTSVSQPALGVLRDVKAAPRVRRAAG